MEQSYKSMKEDFVSNLSGGTIGEINQVTAVAPVSAIWPHLYPVLMTMAGKGCLSAMVSSSDPARFLREQKPRDISY